MKKSWCVTLVFIQCLKYSLHQIENISNRGKWLHPWSACSNKPSCRSLHCLAFRIDMKPLFLRINRIPNVHISEDEEGGKEIELSDDPYDCMRLNVENVPCIVTLCKVRMDHRLLFSSYSLPPVLLQCLFADTTPSQSYTVQCIIGVWLYTLATIRFDSHYWLHDPIQHDSLNVLNKILTMERLHIYYWIINNVHCYEQRFNLVNKMYYSFTIS